MNAISSRVTEGVPINNTLSVVRATLLLLDERAFKVCFKFEQVGSNLVPTSLQPHYNRQPPPGPRAAVRRHGVT